MESFDNNPFIQNEAILPCHCENLPFIDPEHGQILTGDLLNVCKNEHRKLITKDLSIENNQLHDRTRLSC